jgi:hypothetical protein
MTISEEEIADQGYFYFLEHYGKKGMQWGVRQKFRNQRAKSTQKQATLKKGIAQRKPTPLNKAAANKAQKTADRAKRWEKGKPTKTDKRHRAVSASVLGVVGAYVALSIVASFGNRPVSSLPKTPSPKVGDIIRQEHATQLSSLTRMHKEGKMDAAQFKKFSETLGKRYDRKLAEVLG